MENIQKFDQLCGELFAKMYACFPEELSLIETYPEKFKNTLEQDEFFNSTIRWLEHNGLIEGCRDSNIIGIPHFIRPTLTAFTMLKMTPASLKGKQSIGDALVDAAKNGSQSAMSELLRDGMLHLAALLSRPF